MTNGIVWGRLPAIAILLRWTASDSEIGLGYLATVSCMAVRAVHHPERKKDLLFDKFGKGSSRFESDYVRCEAVAAV